jgi:hypothetical protein
MAIQRDVVFSIANFASSQKFCQYLVIEGGLETINATASRSNNVKVLHDTARTMSLFPVDIRTKESLEIPKVLCKLAKSSDSAEQQFASLALCNLC